MLYHPIFLCLEALLSFLFIFKGSDLLYLKKFQVQTIVFNVFENLHNLQLKEPTIQHDFQTGKDILVVGMIKNGGAVTKSQLGLFQEVIVQIDQYCG